MVLIIKQNNQNNVNIILFFTYTSQTPDPVLAAFQLAAVSLKAERRREFK